MTGGALEGLSCPTPLERMSEITLAHGGGGLVMRRLIEDILIVLGGPEPGDRHDGAILETPGRRIAFTTDSFVISPLFFPGGDIGSLAVYGTVNDLSMCGAKPLWLSIGMILEEGFPLDLLQKVVGSIANASRAAGVSIVTGDTKVVEHGKCDGIYINTSGVGVVRDGVDVRPGRIEPGDAIIISGDIGRHGISVMALREGIRFETEILSDLAPLNDIVEQLLGSGVDIRCMRDLTRGGLAAALTEISSDSHCDMLIDEQLIPVDGQVRGACELLGFDPVHVANEGRFVLFVPGGQTEAALSIFSSSTCTSQASVIGRVLESRDGTVFFRSPLGTERVMNVLSGEQLPRIC